MIFERRFYSLAACAVTLLALSTTASATITGSGCVVQGAANQTAPATVAAFTAACTAVGAANQFTFSPATDNLNYILPSGGTNTATGFLASGGTACVGTGCSVIGSTGQATTVIPTGCTPSCSSTLYLFHYVIGTGEPTTLNFGTITHDDGITLLLNGVAVTPASAAAPTSAAGTVVGNQAGLFAGESVDLLFDECCGLPAQLTANLPGEANIQSTVPEPGSIVLFGSAVLGVVFTLRRRKNLA